MKVSLICAAILLADALCWAQTEPAWYPQAKLSSSNINCLDQDDRTRLASRAERGDTSAQDILGTFYLSGCKDNNPARGMGLLVNAASQGNAHAQFRLGQAYQSGIPVEKNISVALAWFEKSAAQGNVQAQNNIGVIYLQGDGADAVQAAKLFQSAAEKNLPEAEYNLATLYDQGRGVARDYAAARKWYQQAAMSRDPDAEYRLATLIEKGLGGEKDQAAATRWLRLAAQDGSGDAEIELGLRSPSHEQSAGPGYRQYQLAQAMFTGRGMPKDQAGALSHLEKSAEAGYPPAFLTLARMYFRGEGVARNEAKAMGYFEQAIAADPSNDIACNAYAWALLSALDPAVRNPGKALEYATRAIELSRGSHAYQFDTQAHAYFGLGDPKNAVQSESKAVALEPDNEFYQQALADFKNSK